MKNKTPQNRREFVTEWNAQFTRPANFSRAFYFRVFPTILESGLTLSKMRCANSYYINKREKNNFIE